MPITAWPSRAGIEMSECRLLEEKQRAAFHDPALRPRPFRRQDPHAVLVRVGTLRFQRCRGSMATNRRSAVIQRLKPGTRRAAGDVPAHGVQRAGPEIRMIIRAISRFLMDRAGAVGGWLPAFWNVIWSFNPAGNWTDRPPDEHQRQARTASTRGRPARCRRAIWAYGTPPN